MSETAKLIDKVTFKLNIPQLLAIIGGTVTLYSAFASLRTDIQLVSMKVEQHIEAQMILAKNISNIEVDQKTQDSRINEIDKRVYRLEKAEKISN